MKAGFLQFEPAFGEPDKNISRIEKLISGENFDLIVIPELANSGYLFSDEEELQTLSEEIPGGRFCGFLRDMCADKNCYIVSGICERAGDKIYNSAILVHPDGHIDTYRKIHLFYEEKMWFTPGDQPPEVYNLNFPPFEGGEGDDNADSRAQQSNPINVKVGIMVCFDWRFPEIARTLALKGAQIICHPSNLVMAHCQDAMVIRALENQVFTITANRIGEDVRKDKRLAFTGRSIMVKPNGDVIHIATEDKEEFFITKIDPALALDKSVTKYNNIFEDRREELYFK